MKKCILAISLAFALIGCAEKNPYAETENVASDYNVVPLPLKMEAQKGRFLLNNQTIVYAGNKLIL